MPIVWCFAADDCLVKSQPCQSHWVIEQFLEVIWRQTQIVTSYIFKIRLPNKLVIVLMRVAKPNRHDKKKITEITYLGHEQLLSPQWTPCWFTQKHGLEFKLKWTLYHPWRCIPVKFLWDDIFVCLFVWVFVHRCPGSQLQNIFVQCTTEEMQCFILCLNECSQHWRWCFKQ